MDKPAQDFFEGALLGNGAMGVVVCTRPDSVLIHLGHNDVWDIRVAENNREELVTFDELWSRLKRNTPEDATWFKDYCVMARQNYAQPYPRPWPCGSLLLGFDRRRAEVLCHELRIDIGQCNVSLLVDNRPATLEVFADLEADRLWLRMVDAQGRPAPAPFDRIRWMPESGMATTSASTEESLSFRQILPVLGEAREKDKALRMSVRVNGPIAPGPPQDRPFAACVLLEHGRASLIPRAGSGDVPKPTQERVEAASAASRALWKQYWSKSGVRLADDLLERTWYHNLYFLNCCVRPGAACPGLFANWSHGTIGTAWHGDYHANYNMQQPFWGTFSSNHVEKHLPYVNLVHFLLPISRSWARDHYKLPGAFFPHSSYPVEMTMMPYPVPTWGAEVCETPWTVQSLWWHYLYTMDREFLRSRAFEPMREAVLFMNAYMRRPEARGSRWGDDKFHIYPTVVPELHGIKADPRFCADCIVDVALTKFLFKAYLEACRVLAIEEQEHELMGQVREVLAHFPRYPTRESSRGAVFVSVSGESPEQVYNTPNSLAPVFPGEDIGLHSPREELEIALNTWRNHRNEGGNDLVFLNLQGARLGVLDLEKFKRQIRYCQMPNGACTDMVLQAGGRYQDDTDYAFMARMGVWFENLALPVVINECLLRSYTGQLRFFPNWPREKDACFQDFRAVGAFLVSAELAGSELQWIRVRSEAGGPLRVINPWPGAVSVLHGQNLRVMQGPLLEVNTRAGDIVEFRSRRP